MYVQYVCMRVYARLYTKYLCNNPVECMYICTVCMYIFECFYALKKLSVKEFYILTKLNTLLKLKKIKGETIDENSSICGCRVVDSCKKGKAAYKVELWLKTRDPQTCNAIKEKMIKVGLDVSGGDSQQPPIFDIYRRGK